MDCLSTGNRNLAAHETRSIADVYKSYTYFQDGDVLLAKITPCFENGKLGVARELKSGIGFGSSEFFVIRPGNQILSNYIYYYLDQQCFRDAGKRVMTGAVGHKRVPREFLEALPTPLPPLEEQRRIVAVLDEAFEGLDRARAHAEANLLDARELFEGYLADLLTHPHRSWETTHLSRFCEKITVGHVGPMAKRYAASGTPFLRSQNVRPFKIDLTDVKYIDEAFVNELKKSELRPGDVAIVRTGYPGTCAVVPDELEVANCADLVIARTGSKLNPHFLALLLNSRYGKKLVAGAAVGAAQKHFNVGAAKRAIFPFPPLETQERLVEKANDLRAATGDLEKISSAKSAYLEDLRQSLLQRAFAGELT